MFKVYFNIICYIYIVTNLNCVKSINDTKTVQIKNGKIRGTTLKTFSNKIYFAFQQIPYATPPTGLQRFKEPIPPITWVGVLDTTKATKVCPQLTKDSSQENEDCLYLNVYTPIDPQNITELTSVYFWIHGGAFLRNDGNFNSVGPQYFMDENVVLVTVNFRQGPLGFLCLSDGSIPCNLGLKDQNLALKWVKDNIEVFGGNNAKVTIGGSSSGSAIVGHHILSKRSTGLFRAAIMQSGSPLNSKMFQKNPDYYAYQMGAVLNENFNPKNSSVDELIEILMNVPVEDFKKGSLSIPINMRNSVGNDDNTIWAPVIENDSESAFVVGPMYENIKNGNINLVTTMIGVASEEEMYFIKPGRKIPGVLDLEELKNSSKLFDEDQRNLINGNLNINKNNKLIAGKELQLVYTNKTFQEDFGSFVRFMSDAKYTTSIAKYAELQSKYTKVYFYEFAYDGILGQNNFTVEGAQTVGHTELINYLFGVDSYKDLSDYPLLDIKVHEQVLRMWTNFIKYLNPTPYKESLLNDIIWQEMTENNFIFLKINGTLRMDENLKVYRQWKSIFNKYADVFQITY